MISGLPPDVVKQQDKADIYAPIGSGNYSWRFWGKKCLLRSAEVLSRRGWVPIEQAYIEGCEIAQWDIDRRISFVVPSGWFVDQYTGDISILQNQRIFHESTPDHRMPVLVGNKIVDFLVCKYPNSGRCSAPLSGIYTEGQITLPDPLIRLMVAFQADGAWNSNGIRIRLSKEKKIERIKSILDLADIDYNDTDSGIYISAYHPATKLIKLVMGHQKLFGPWLLELSQESLRVFLEELPHWDGYNIRGQYFTTIKQNADWVQIVAHLCGKATNISFQDNSNTDAYGNKILYRLNIRDTCTPASHAIEKSTRYVENEPILCPTVSSGYFMCRQKGLVSITGNCNHGLNYDEGYRTFSFILEIPEKDGKLLVDTYHRSYPGVR
jgi:hypothetical protein